MPSSSTIPPCQNIGTGVTWNKNYTFAFEGDTSSFPNIVSGFTTGTGLWQTAAASPYGSRIRFEQVAPNSGANIRIVAMPTLAGGEGYACLDPANGARCLAETQEIRYRLDRACGGRLSKRGRLDARRRVLQRLFDERPVSPPGPAFGEEKVERCDSH